MENSYQNNSVQFNFYTASSNRKYIWSSSYGTLTIVAFQTVHFDKKKKERRKDRQKKKKEDKR